eukprot:CAMPEP_0167758876 /NCGR_PEP_ID=MMETSP0110_2-20121227/10714_1 /TAXON_ID=629695 /ORGANISM="Gymnochlora sp., Strain CCMP2014" /LENGTH=137 /DNA_ID=CAMNT_0007645205 /DNA_START=190 /DNA_END=603 /DNA_ORIENTATION=+
MKYEVEDEKRKNQWEKDAPKRAEDRKLAEAGEEFIQHLEAVEHNRKMMKQRLKQRREERELQEFIRESIQEKSNKRQRTSEENSESEKVPTSTNVEKLIMDRIANSGSDDDTLSSDNSELSEAKEDSKATKISIRSS